MAHDVSPWMRQSMKKSGAASGPSSVHGKITGNGTTMHSKICAPSVRNYADGGEVESSGEKVGFFERLRMGNIDDPSSEAYNRFGAGKRAVEDIQRMSPPPRESVASMDGLEPDTKADSVSNAAVEALSAPSAPRQSVASMDGLEKESAHAAKAADKASYKAGDFKSAPRPVRPPPVKVVKAVVPKPVQSSTDTGDESERRAARYPAPAAYKGRDYVVFKRVADEAEKNPNISDAARSAARANAARAKKAYEDAAELEKQSGASRR